MIPQKPTIAFDFDGVFAAYDGWKGGIIGAPLNQGRVLATLQDYKGYRTVLYSCRTNPVFDPEYGPSHEEKIRIWLDENGLDFVEIFTQGKPVAAVYVDDRGMFFDQKHGDRKGYAVSLDKRIQQRLASEEVSR